MKKLKLIIAIIIALGVSLYGNSMTPNLDNIGYKKPLNPFSLEQCTAFVWGRAYEKKGIKIKFSVDSGRHAKNWLKYVVGLKTGNVIRANSIVVWGGDFHRKSNGSYKNAYGHVAFIEKIENNYVYFNEANFKTYSSGGGYDGYVKKWTLDKFKRYRPYAGKILGYLYLDSTDTTSTAIVDGAGSLIRAEILNTVDRYKCQCIEMRQICKYILVHLLSLSNGKQQIIVKN